MWLRSSPWRPLTVTHSLISGPGRTATTLESSRELLPWRLTMTRLPWASSELMVLSALPEPEGQAQNGGGQAGGGNGGDGELLHDGCSSRLRVGAVERVTRFRLIG